MHLEDMATVLPSDWEPMDIVSERFKIVELFDDSPEFDFVMQHILGDYYLKIDGVYKLQNPFLYTKFRLKVHEYEKRGPLDLKVLFHDTAYENVTSIAEYNLDWRYGERHKFGPGVYFSVSPSLANKHSWKTNIPLRSMFISAVLTQNVQEVQGDIFLPDFGYDTVLCHNRATYVKYFDCEYYPQYFVNYVSVR